MSVRQRSNRALCYSVTGYACRIGRRHGSIIRNCRAAVARSWDLIRGDPSRTLLGGGNQSDQEGAAIPDGFVGHDGAIQEDATRIGSSRREQCDDLVQFGVADETGL